MKYISFLVLIASVAFSSCSQKDHKKSKQEADSLSADSIPTVIVPERIEAVIGRELAFDKYTLPDTIPYRDTVRIIQWDTIREQLSFLDSIQRNPASWGILQNYRNGNGEAPLVSSYKRNEYKNIADDYGIERFQGIPLYASLGDTIPPLRYGLDGSLVKICANDSIYTSLEPIYIGGKWQVPSKYVKRIEAESLSFKRVVFVDRVRQYIITLEQSADQWLVRSINPATTGRHHPVMQKETPLGIFVVQEKKAKMFFWVDGTTRIGGFAPYASRFCNGGYIHGVPVNLPRTSMIEYSASLGTTPRSHMCVRNATSHAKFVFDWAEAERSLVFVIE